MHVKSVKRTCGKIKKKYQDSIIFKSDVHRKKKELSEALLISN